MKLLPIYKQMMFEELVDEDYPPEFDIEYFKKLNSFNKRIRYCEAKLYRISSGSSRIVYRIDDQKALKLARNQKGLAQNESEISFGNEPFLEDVVANIFDYDENNLWVEMELATKLSVNDFKRITGYNFNDYQTIITFYGNEVNKHMNTQRPKIDRELYDKMWNDEDGFVYSMFDFIGNYDVPVGDLTRINSYGIVKRNGQEQIVLVDYGLTHDVYKTHYTKKSGYAY